MAKYGKKASEAVGEAMHELKEGTLRSGRSGTRVRSRKQAIAIGLSEARREGGKVPAKSKSASGSSRRRTAKSGGRSRTATGGSRASGGSRTTTRRGGGSRAKTRAKGGAARKSAGGGRR